MTMPAGNTLIPVIGVLLTVSVTHRSLSGITTIRRHLGPTRESTCDNLLTHRLINLPASVMRRRTVVPTVEAVADWCDALARDTSAGTTLHRALSRQPIDPAVAMATAPLRLALERGRSVGAAVEILVTPDGRPDGPLRLVGSVIAGLAHLGGGAATPLRRVAGTLRLRSADRQERQAHSAQARMSAHVLTVLPLATLALLLVTDAHIRAFVVGPIGVLVVSAGGALNTVGWLWMRRIVGRAT